MNISTCWCYSSGAVGVGYAPEGLDLLTCTPLAQGGALGNGPGIAPVRCLKRDEQVNAL